MCRYVDCMLTPSPLLSWQSLLSLLLCWALIQRPDQAQWDESHIPGKFISCVASCPRCRLWKAHALAATQDPSRIGRYTLLKLWLSFFFLCLVLLGFDLRALHLLDRHSAAWATSPALSAIVYFSGKVCDFCLGPASEHDLPTSTFYIAGITSMNHHVQPWMLLFDPLPWPAESDVRHSVIQERHDKLIGR
jgi:hypothetical protein